MNTSRQPQPNRIIHVPRRFVTDEWGGTETVILEISKVQQRHGWHPEIWTSMALSKQREDSIGGIPVQRYPYRYPFFGLSQKDKQLMDKKGGNLMSPQILWSMMKSKDVRLFHAHSLKRLGGGKFLQRHAGKKNHLSSHYMAVFSMFQNLNSTKCCNPSREKLNGANFTEHWFDHAKF